MDRRVFLRAFGLGAAAAVVAPELVLDPERALWVPGRKTIFLPTVVQPLAFNPKVFSLVMEELLTTEGQRVLKNSMKRATRVNWSYEANALRVDVLEGCRVIRPELALRIRT